MKKGETNNPQGRPKGSKNRTTTEIRQLFTKLLTDNLESMESDLKQLEPGQRLKAVLELARFCVPTLRAIEVKAEIEEAEKDGYRYDLMTTDELLFIVELGKKYSTKNNTTPKDLSKMSTENLIIISDHIDSQNN